MDDNTTFTKEELNELHLEIDNAINYLENARYAILNIKEDVIHQSAIDEL